MSRRDLSITKPSILRLFQCFFFLFVIRPRLPEWLFARLSLQSAACALNRITDNRLQSRRSHFIRSKIFCSNSYRRLIAKRKSKSTSFHCITAYASSVVELWFAAAEFPKGAVAANASTTSTTVISSLPAEGHRPVQGTYRRIGTPCHWNSSSSPAN